MDEIYFIQIVNGQPHGGPIGLVNFQAAFPYVNLNNLPPEFAEFNHSPKPARKMYEVVEGPFYTYDGKVVHESWTTRPMTDEERVEDDELVRQQLMRNHQKLKNIALEKIQNASDDAEKMDWENYLRELDSWQLTDLDQPNFPQFPRPISPIKPLPVAEIDETGSPPDVTG